MNDAEREALERRIDELCQEVEQLRKQLHDQQDTAEHNFVRNAREYKRVCDENAKLRWLVNGLTWCCENYGCDNRCQLYDESEPDDCCEQRLKRELGIEVDE